MATVEKEIPVVWKTKKSVVRRLLGKTGQPLFDDLLVKTQDVAVKNSWPLQQITVDYYQDPEEDWENVVVTLDFRCSHPNARKLWQSYLKFVEAAEEELGETAKETLLNKIHYEFECDP